ncbi:hypothetical protein BZA77DRAFT_376507 [Pyronema omphalodes]|nr:hypothetical protein BZA77DRAFT_376507 [Pyronema omphalodes]
MEFYNQPVPGTYTVDWKQWFDLPNEDGTFIKVIAVTTQQANYWVVAYSIIVKLIFAAVFQMVVDLVLIYFPLKNFGNRIIMLVAFYNAHNPSTAAVMMFNYIYLSIFSTGERTEDRNPITVAVIMFNYIRRLIFRIGSIIGNIIRIILRIITRNKFGNGIGKKNAGPRKHLRKVDWSTFNAALALMLIAVTVIGATSAAQFVVSAKQLTKRHATRASLGSIFYPNFTEVLASTNMNTTAFSKIKPIRSSAGFQALGRYETSRMRLADRVKLQTIEGMSGQNVTREYIYSYNLTGYEMGLQYAPTLLYKVTGNCKTDYSMYSINPNGDRDWYESYPGFSEGFTPFEQERMMPFLNTNPWQQYDSSKKIIYQSTDEIARNGYMFTIIPYTAGRFTTKRTTNIRDPWYLTEETPTFNASVTGYRFQGGRFGFYRVKRGRPGLRCLQHDEFTLNGVTVRNAGLLQNLPSLRISKFLRDDVLATEFGTAPLVQLTRNLGYNSLASAVFYDPPAGTFDVSQANMTEDMFKLVALSFLYSREAVRNIPLLYSAIKDSGLDIPNLAAVNGVVPYENADIILETSEVAALSVLVLIITPIICAVVWLLVVVRRLGLQPVPAPHSNIHGPLNRLKLHSVGLHATQLYRLIDESFGKYRKFSGRLSTTSYIKEVDDARPGNVEKGPKPSPDASQTSASIEESKKHQSAASNHDAHTKNASVTVKQSQQSPLVALPIFVLFDEFGKLHYPVNKHDAKTPDESFNAPTESVGKYRKWSGRLSMTPYIKEVDDAGPGDVEKGPKSSPDASQTSASIEESKKHQSAASNRDADIKNASVTVEQSQQSPQDASLTSVRIDEFGKLQSSVSNQETKTPNESVSATTGVKVDAEISRSDSRDSTDGKESESKPQYDIFLTLNRPSASNRGFSSSSGKWDISYIIP